MHSSTTSLLGLCRAHGKLLLGTLLVAVFKAHKQPTLLLFSPCPLCPVTELKTSPHDRQRVIIQPLRNRVMPLPNRAQPPNYTATVRISVYAAAKVLSFHSFTATAKPVVFSFRSCPHVYCCRITVPPCTRTTVPPYARDVVPYRAILLLLFHASPSPKSGCTLLSHARTVPTCHRHITLPSCLKCTSYHVFFGALTQLY